MIARSLRDDSRNWLLAAIAALAAHGAIAALVLAWARPQAVTVPEPVVLLELPPPGPADKAERLALQQVVPERLPQPDVQPIAPQLDIPPVRVPLPSAPVLVASPQPAPAKPAAAATPVQAAASAPTPAVASGSASGTDPRARKQEADYFALVSAHLNRRKVYPAEARQARQQGVVTVRFTVDRDGVISSVSIKRGSGHDILDRATLDLLQRVAPLPRMPTSMARASVTLSLPIDYSLRTR